MTFARRSSSPVWTVLALTAIVALAAGWRLFQIGRLPPGLSYDEAWNDRQALRVVQEHARPVYFVDEWGDVEEPLHIYLIAGLFALTGPQAVGGRIVSALLGTLTVPLLFLAVREMLRGLRATAPAHSDRVALLAAFVLATLYWHVHYTRLGMEPPSVPMLATLAFWLLWRAFNRGGWFDYALAGGALGLSLYTHPSARFLPFVVASFVVWRWSRDRGMIRRELPRFGLLVVCAIVVFAPLGLFFARHPDLFFYRAGQASVITFSGGLAPLAQNLVGVIGGLVWRGDTNLRLNLPGRPGLDAVQLLLFAIGALYALGRDRRRVLAFPLLWAGIMVLPSVFSDAAPHFGRMLGATPALAILVAFGLAQVSNFKYQISNVKRATWIGLVVAGGLLAYSTVEMARDYFVTWAHDPGLYTAFDVGLRESAEYLAALPRDELLSLSPVSRDLPIFRFTFHDDVSRLKTFNGRRCVVYPIEPGRDWTHVTVVAEETHSLETVKSLFPSGQAAKEFFDVGAPYAIAWRVKAGTRAQSPLEELGVFDERIELVGSEIPGTMFRAGATLPITLSWTSRVALDTNYTIFVHLAPAQDVPPVAQEDAQPCDNSYPATWWSPGEIVQENRRIVIPGDALPGQYVLAVGIYDLATGRRLPVRSSGALLGDSLVLGRVTIVP